MISLLIILLIGVINAVAAYDQDILMISDARWRRSPEAWVEAILYVLIWPAQVVYWIYTRLVDLGYWVFARWMS